MIALCCKGVAILFQKMLAIEIIFFSNRIVQGSLCTTHFFTSHFKLRVFSDI